MISLNAAPSLVPELFYGIKVGTFRRPVQDVDIICRHLTARRDCCRHLHSRRADERIYRRRGERFADACINEWDRFGGGSVLVWGRIMGGNKTRSIVINGNINAQTYINDVLPVEALPFIQFHGLNVAFMHDNTRPHSSAITRHSFSTNAVNVLDWSANSPVLNPIEQVWDELGRRVRINHAHTVNDFAAALQAKWAILPAPFIQRYVNSMHRRITACTEKNGGHMRY